MSPSLRFLSEPQPGVVAILLPRGYENINIVEVPVLEDISDDRYVGLHSDPIPVEAIGSLGVVHNENYGH